MNIKIRANKTDKSMMELFTVSKGSKYTYLWAVVHEDFFYEGDNDYDDASALIERLQDGEEVTISMKFKKEE